MLKALAAIALTAIPLTAAAHSNSTCDRACLRGILDHYLHAVVSHDPSGAPLSGAYRQTENAVSVPVGRGVWRSVTGLGPVERRYFDPVTGQAAYFGIVHEGSRLAIVTARLLIADRAVAEAEWYIARDGDPGLPNAKPPNAWNPTSLIAHPPPKRVVPVRERLPRERMIAIANSYYDAIVAHDGSIALAQPGCDRYENGTRVTGRRGGKNDGCVSGLEHFNLTYVAARRVTFVDEEAGAVLGMGVFIRRPGSSVPRNAFSEWFFIDDGKIHNIWTAMFYPPPQLPVPNWPPFLGNFPLAAGVIPTAAPAAH